VIVRRVLCAPFVGRRDELAYLRERRLDAGLSRGGLVLIAGSAGLGKSRLISEFFGSLVSSRWKIGYGSCLQFASRPYAPILEILASVDPKPFELAAAATRREQFDAIVARLTEIGSRRPLGIVVEDLHWGDAATLDFLTFLATKLHRMRVLVVASFRSDELHPGHRALAATAKIERSPRAGRIDLAPLRGVELRTFIDEALTGFTLPDETRRAIARAGEGNPFFTEELLKSAVERQANRTDHSARHGLPQTVRAGLLERLRPFDEDERRIVTQAAVIGRAFHLELLATTLGTEPEQLLPTLRRARDFQLLEEVRSSVFRFRHGLTHEAIYADFLGAELTPRHRAIALALEDLPAEERPIEALAYHWWAAGDGPKAAHYNELSGDAAVRVHAHDDAIAFYERALEAVQLDSLERGSIVEKIAERHVMLNSLEEAQAAYATAADIFRKARDHEREARCLSYAAMAAYTVGQPQPTAALEAMLLRLDPDDYLAVSRAHLGLAWLAATFWFPTRAAHHLEQVDERALSAASDIRLRFHNVATWIAMTVGDIDRFRREHAAWVQEAMSLRRDYTVASAYVNGAMCLSFFGLHDEALENIERALKIARAARNELGQEGAHANAAMSYLLKGDLARARAALENVPPTTDNRVNVTLATAWGTIVAAHLGDEALIEKWFDGFEDTIVGAPEIESGAGFAEIMVRRGRHRDAAALLHRAIPDCELIRGNMLTLLAAARYAAPADRARAREHLTRASTGPTEMPERAALALFDAITYRQENRTLEAIELARRAAEGFRNLGFPLLEAAALEVAGDIEAALVLFRRCGATYDVRRLEGERHAEHAAKPQAAAEAQNALSQREREIATLAAAGRSNIEIARQLAITHKTVEKHLGAVYQKLRISSRMQLAASLTAPHEAAR
jgi:DNA-binding CsgD family transcriptional regulator/tetratricopeptide (TPR) repeat protein